MAVESSKGVREKVFRFICAIPRKVTKNPEKSFFESETHVVGELPWIAFLQYECSKRTGNVPFLGVYVKCTKKEKSNWKCNASASWKLFPIGSHSEIFYKIFNLDFSYENPVWGQAQFCNWGTMHNKYTIKRKIMLEVSIEVNTTELQLVGYPQMYTSKFLVGQPGVTDCVLVVSGVRVHVIKGLLANASTYFSTLFNDKPPDKEIELNGVDHLEFMTFLEQLYPCGMNITDENLDVLLKMACGFSARLLFEECERHLLKSTRISKAKKLLLAFKYPISVEAKAQIMSEIKTIADLKPLGKIKEYMDLNHQCKASLLDKLVA